MDQGRPRLLEDGRWAMRRLVNSNVCSVLASRRGGSVGCGTWACTASPQVGRCSQANNVLGISSLVACCVRIIWRFVPPAEIFLVRASLPFSLGRTHARSLALVS